MLKKVRYNISYLVYCQGVEEIGVLGQGVELEPVPINVDGEHLLSVRREGDL